MAHAKTSFEFPGNFDPIVFGELLKRHHANLRDGLNISTAAVEEILETAYKNSNSD